VHHDAAQQGCAIVYIFFTWVILLAVEGKVLHFSVNSTYDAVFGALS